jgi:hypothetical protein
MKYPHCPLPGVFFCFSAFLLVLRVLRVLAACRELQVDGEFPFELAELVHQLLVARSVLHAVADPCNHDWTTVRPVMPIKPVPLTCLDDGDDVQVGDRGGGARSFSLLSAIFVLSFLMYQIGLTKYESTPIRRFFFTAPHRTAPPSGGGNSQAPREHAARVHARAGRSFGPCPPARGSGGGGERAYIRPVVGVAGELDP